MHQFKINGALHLDKADEAPDQPGLYVWYGRLSVGAADWDESLAGTNSVAQSQLLRALRDHSVKHRQQPLQLDAVANFSTRWSGGLGPVLPEAWDDEFVGTWTADGEHEVARATSSNTGRSELLSLLESVFPLFCSPLYIGLAIDQSLRSRLRQHRTQLRRHWENASRDPDYPSRISQPRNFADRAIKVGFSPADLYFYTLHIEDGGNGLPDIRHDELLRSAEWLLNRWANPILGRK
jgi:hypothetical protein